MTAPEAQPTTGSGRGRQPDKHAIFLSSLGSGSSHLVTLRACKLCADQEFHGEKIVSAQLAHSGWHRLADHLRAVAGSVAGF